MEIDIAKLRGSHVYLEFLSPSHREAIRTLAKNEVIWEFNKTLPGDDSYDAAYDSYFDAALDKNGLGGQQTFVIKQTDDNSIIGMTRFYEISPAIIRIASDQRYFTYLHDTPAIISIAEGDARLSMERELASGQGQRFDLLAIDAFSGDAPPVHLLTEEAFQIYLNQIRPDGIIAVHITNSYLDFRPVVAPAAAHFNLASVVIHSDGDKKATGYNDWVLLSHDKALIDSLSAAGTRLETRPDVAAWTDNHSNLFQILRSRH